MRRICEHTGNKSIDLGTRKFVGCVAKYTIRRAVTGFYVPTAVSGKNGITAFVKYALEQPTVDQGLSAGIRRRSAAWPRYSLRFLSHN